MFSRPALLLLVVGLTSVSALSGAIAKPFSPVIQRDSEALEDRQEVDPATCPTIKCAAGFHPVFHSGTRHCSCVLNSTPCGNTIYCGAGSHALLQENSNVCYCQADAGTEGCPKMKCREGMHAVYHNEIHQCGCMDDCPGLNCTELEHPVWNFASLECSCGLMSNKPREVALEPAAEAAEDISTHTIIKTTYTGPYTKRDTSDSPASINPGGPMIAITTGAQNPGGPMITVTATDSIRILPSPILPHPGRTCPEMICTDDMYAAFNMTSKICECKPMRGISPIPTPTIIGPGRPITARDETTFVTSTRTFKPTACPSHNVMCEVGKEPTFNLKNGKCECQPFPSTTLNPLPTITGHTGMCRDILCIAEMHPVWNETLGGCECVWIDGFGPVTVYSR